MHPRTTTIVHAAAALAVLAAACADNNQAVKPDEMSAAAHRDEARRENRGAQAHADSYSPTAARSNPFRDPITHSENDYLYAVPVYNPTDVNLRAAEQHRAHARQHEEAARYLEHFEEAECSDFPPATRAACPLLGPVTTLEDIPGGVRAHLTPGTRVDAVVAHMRCHFAYARARAFPEALSCPLYMRGISIKQAPDPMAVDITVADPRQVTELRARAREEAVYAQIKNQ
jgi:hypothetical protein